MKFSAKPFGIYTLAIIMGLSSGCVTSLPENNRVMRYRPQSIALPSNQSEVVATENSETNQVTKTDNTVVVSNATENNDIKEPAKVLPSEDKHGKLRSLKRGDRLIINLRGIPVPKEIKDIVDGWGEVTLPYIGEIKMVGKTVSEAERLIETSYIEGGIYKQINVIVVAEDEVYFVRGEVTRRGKYSLSGAVTLLQAISESGGYTPFANLKKIKVMRGDEVLVYNGKDIAKGKISDPPIFADDIIEVSRRVIW